MPNASIPGVSGAHWSHPLLFVGMGGVFFRRDRKPPAEVINDRNGEVVNLFRINALQAGDTLPRVRRGRDLGAGNAGLSAAGILRAMRRLGANVGPVLPADVA